MSHYHEGDVAKEALEAASENYFDVPTGALGSTKATKTERPNRAPTIGNKPPTPTQAAPTTPTTKPAPTKPLATSNPPKINQSSDAAALEAALAGTVAKEIIMKELVLESLPIGSGAYGVVYRGTWRGAKVAVKKLRVRDLTEKELTEFRREAALMTLIGNHPNVLPICGIVLEDPDYCLVSPFCKNGSVYDYIKKHRNDMPMIDIARFARDSAAGVLHLHCERIIHRDIAARNFLVDDNLNVRISDFGMSRMLQEKEQGKTTSMVGPVKYMAPEAILECKYSNKSDAFSFGVFIWELLEKTDPYPGEPLLQIAIEVAREGRRLDIPEDAPKPLETVMERCWRKNPDERPDFNEILVILDEFLENLQNEKSLDFRRKSSAMLQRNREKKAAEEEEDEEYVAYSTQDYSDDKKNPYMSLTSTQKPAPATSTSNYSAMYTEGLEFYTKVEENYVELVNRIRNRETGFTIKDRKYHFKSYPTCFVASEAVEWLIQNSKAKDKDEAIELGNYLIRRKVIVHVVEQTKRFQDGYFFYKFIDKQKIVVIGGGFAGSTIAKRLETEYEVTLIEKRDYFEFVPAFPFLPCSSIPSSTPSCSQATLLALSTVDLKFDSSAAADDCGCDPTRKGTVSGNSAQTSSNSISKRKNARIKCKHTDYLALTQVIVAEKGVEELKANEVVVEQEGELRVIPFDYCCVCPGSLHNVPPTWEGWSARGEGGGGSRGGTKYFDCRDRRQMKRSRRVLNEKSCVNVVIIGGGVVGVELGAEIAATWPDKRLTILERHPEGLLSRFPPGAAKLATNFFEKSSNVRILIGQEAVRMETITGGGSSRSDGVVEEGSSSAAYHLIHTDKGKEVKADLIFLCVGSIPATGFMKKNFSALLNQKGEAMVNTHLQLEGHPTIFCLGDIAAVRNDKRGVGRAETAVLSQGTVQALDKALSASQPVLPSKQEKEKEKGGKWGKKGKGSKKKGGAEADVPLPPNFYKSEEKLAAIAEKHAEIVAENVRLFDRNEKMVAYKTSATRKVIISLGPQRSIIVQENGSVSEGKGNIKAKHLKKLRGFRFERATTFV